MKEILFQKMENRAEGGFTTWGAPWPKGEVKTDTSFMLKAANKTEVPLQTRISAYWPDGSIKWSTHTAHINEAIDCLTLKTIESKEEKAVEGITTEETDDFIKINAGVTTAVVPKSGTHIVDDLRIHGRKSATYGKLIAILEERRQDGEVVTRREVPYTGEINETRIEERGPLKCVIRIDGSHRSKGRSILPFILRLTFHYNDDTVGITHTFLYDGEEEKDFLKGLGVQFSCPLQGELYNRHVKIGGDYGYFHESMKLLLSWRPRVPETLYKAQISGENLVLEEEENALKALDDITVWNNYHICQDSASHFVIKKRTAKENCCYIDALHGNRADGSASIAGEEGGIAIGMKDFWQKYPSGYWFDDITKDEALVTAWIWSPEVEAMDFRHYDTEGHASAYYEGFDEVLASAYGIANTNEIIIKGYNGSIASDECLSKFSTQVQKPLVMLASPEYYHDVKAFGVWSLPKKETEAQQWMEDQLNQAIDFYKKEIDVRGWYGLFNYGDFMHTYDKTRHSWRYDMGGYAWQNTELVPTLWLWYAFLRTGREDIYTLAEAMSRHCSEVDTYHFGPYKGLGSRHNVRHWGCSCKEPRIAMAGHHRFYYYLTGDHRMEDIFDDVKDGDFSTLNIDPLRHFYDKESMVYKTHARSGPDWSSYCANWMTEWERHKNDTYKNKLTTGIADLKTMPLKLISGSNFEYDPETSHFRYIGENASGGSHLQICMGGPQVWFELADMLEDPEWNQMMADYGRFYYLPKELKAKVSNGIVSTGGFAFPYMASGMAAYGANYYKDENLAHWTWKYLIEALALEDENGFKPNVEEKTANQKKLDEIPWISTNFAAQWCLNAIVVPELIGDYMPTTIEEVKKENWVEAFSI